MLDGTPESRHGRGWSEAEDATLVDGVREGLDQQQLADRLGRSPASILYRLNSSFCLPLRTTTTRWNGYESGLLTTPHTRGGMRATNASTNDTNGAGITMRRTSRPRPPPPQWTKY